VNYFTLRWLSKKCKVYTHHGWCAPCNRRGAPRRGRDNEKARNHDGASKPASGPQEHPAYGSI